MDTVRIFSEFVAAKIKDYLPIKYQEADCRVKESIGNNGIYQSGIALHLPGESGERTIYMDRYYSELKAGIPMNKIMGEIAVQLDGCRELDLMLKDSRIEDYQYVKPYLSISLINKGANRRKLLHMPYMEMEDLAMICRVELPYPEGLVVTEVMNEFLKTWGVSKEAMFGAALKNLWEYKDFTLQELAPMVDHLQGYRCEPENLLDIPDGAPVDLQEMLDVLTNREKVRGASAILCPRVMNRISDLFPEGFFIIPSSIHETLIVPKRWGFQIKDLKETTRDINRLMVPTEEILSSHIYEYDRDAGRIRQAREPKEKKRGMER